MTGAIICAIWVYLLQDNIYDRRCIGGHCAVDFVYCVLLILNERWNWRWTRINGMRWQHQRVRLFGLMLLFRVFFVGPLILDYYNRQKKYTGLGTREHCPLRRGFGRRMRIWIIPYPNACVFYWSTFLWGGTFWNLLYRVQFSLWVRINKR